MMKRGISKVPVHHHLNPPALIGTDKIVNNLQQQNTSVGKHEVQKPIQCILRNKMIQRIAVEQRVDRVRQ